MCLGQVLWRQMRHAWALTLLLWGALCAVAALQSYTRNTAHFQNRAIQLIMKDMGHNLWFLAADANGLDVMTGASTLPTLPETRVHQLAADRRLASTYWANLLQARIPIEGQTVLLTGYEPIDDHQVTEEKAHLLQPLPAGAAALGHTLAQDWSLRAGDTAHWHGRHYRIETVHPPTGTLDDMRLWIPLAEAQTWLDLPGQVNVMLGFLCMQGRSLDAGLARMEHHVRQSYSDLQVMPLRTLLNARELARLTTSRALHHLLTALMVVTGLLVATIGWVDVNERRHELAILRALGAGLGDVLTLFLGKLVLLALAGALIGFLLGSAAAVAWLSPFMVTHTQPVAFLWADIPGLLLRTLLLIALASIVPLVRLARMDPTRILAEE